MGGEGEYAATLGRKMNAKSQKKRMVTTVELGRALNAALLEGVADAADALDVGDGVGEFEFELDTKSVGLVSVKVPVVLVLVV